MSSGRICPVVMHWMEISQQARFERETSIPNQSPWALCHWLQGTPESIQHFFYGWYCFSDDGNIFSGDGSEKTGVVEIASCDDSFRKVINRVVTFCTDIMMINIFISVITSFKTFGPSGTWNFTPKIILMSSGHNYLAKALLKRRV